MTAPDHALEPSRNLLCERGGIHTWVHKTANVLNKFPKSMQPAVKADLREIYQAETRAAAQIAMDTFPPRNTPAKYEKAVSCLTRDREALLAFYGFPADHWDHLPHRQSDRERVSPPVRHRTVRDQGRALAESRETQWSSSSFRLPRRHGKDSGAQTGCHLVIEGVKFADGVATNDARKTAPLDQAASTQNGQ